MLKLTLSSLSLSLLIIGCDGPRQAVDDVPPTPASTAEATARPDLTGAWLLERIAGKDALPGATMEILGDKINGTSGCNLYSASYAWDSGVVEVGDVTSNEMACEGEIMNQEIAYFDALAGVTSAKLEGDMLTLDGAKGALIFERAEPAPKLTLESGTWTLDTIIDGETASSPIAGRPIVLTFADGGKMSANLGCNTASGAYTATDGSLTLSDMAMTERACAGDDGQALMEQERALSQKLGSVTAYSFDSEVLVLEAGTAPMLRLRLTDAQAP